MMDEIYFESDQQVVTSRVPGGAQLNGTSNLISRDHDLCSTL